jgi:hypothetical protein
MLDPPPARHELLAASRSSELDVVADAHASRTTFGGCLTGAGVVAWASVSTSPQSDARVEHHKLASPRLSAPAHRRSSRAKHQPRRPQAAPFGSDRRHETSCSQNSLVGLRPTCRFFEPAAVRSWRRSCQRGRIASVTTVQTLACDQDTGLGRNPPLEAASAAPELLASLGRL